MPVLIFLLFLLFNAFPVRADLSSEEKTLKSLSPETYRQLVERTEYDKHVVGIDRFLKLMKEPKAVIFDLRDEKAYWHSHIRGARHMGADIQESRLARLAPDKNNLILLYCENSLYLTRMISLTNVALPQFLAHGYRNVFLLKDAARDLKDMRSQEERFQRLPMVKGDAPEDREAQKAGGD